jgi:DNA helicase II / ATP-dependent DNA helicase PcrA
MTRKVRWEDFAVLYRTNPQSRVLEEALRAQNIPYRVVGGTSFFERKEVVDCLAYLRAVVAPNDEIALRRIINYPTRGIGRTTVLKLAGIARERRVPFGASCRRLRRRRRCGPDRGGPVVPRAAAAGAAPAARGGERGRDAARAARAAAAGRVGRRVLRPARHRGRDPRRARQREDGCRARGQRARRRRHHRPLRARRLGRRPRLRRLGAAQPGRRALARLTLQELDTDEDEQDELGGVTLMTLHSAKGLEFSDVFIVGLEEGIIPHARSLVAEDGDAGYADPLAEERRLLYVGITRARQRLTLSYCLSRKRGGSALAVLPSRYLDEIPAELVELRDTGATTLSAEESTTLRQNFFSSMKDMLADG